MTDVHTADAIADLVRRMDKAEGERDRYREMVDVAHKWADDRVRELQAEQARRERGLTNALWHALDREPGSDRDLIDTVRNLARAVPSGRSRHELARHRRRHPARPDGAQPEPAAGRGAADAGRHRATPPASRPRRPRELLPVMPGVHARLRSGRRRLAVRTLRALDAVAPESEGSA